MRRCPWWLVAILILGLTGAWLARGKQTQPPYLGEWQTYATNGSPTTLRMTLNSNGTFQGTSYDEKDGREAYSGSYRVELFTWPSGEQAESIVLYAKNGKGVLEPYSRLIYDAKDDTLSDLLTTGFARPDKVPAVKRAFETKERKRLGLPPVKVKLNEGNKDVWPERDKGLQDDLRR